MARVLCSGMIHTQLVCTIKVWKHCVYEICIYVQITEDLFLIGHDSQLRSAKALLVELNKELCDNHELSIPYLSHVNAHLQNAVLACRGATGEIEEPPALSSKSAGTPGQKRKGNTLQYASPCYLLMHLLWCVHICLYCTGGPRERNASCC